MQQSPRIFFILPDGKIRPVWENLKLCGERHNRETLPGRETLLAVDEQRVSLDLQIVLQTSLVHQQILENRFDTSLIRFEQVKTG